MIKLKFNERGDALTEGKLNQYRAIKDEIKLLESKIKKTQEEKNKILTDSVKGSSSRFPYIECNFNITGVDPDAENKRARKIDRLKNNLENKKTELVEQEKEMYDFIYSISDSQLRQIFILRFVDGLTQREIARNVHIDQSRVSRKIESFLKAHKKHRIK